MDNHFEPLANGEVLSVAESSLILIGHRTFRVGELAEAIRNQLEYGIAGWSEDKNSWFSEEGIPCEVLRFTAQGWQKGKVRINLEFCPQEGIEFGEQPAQSGYGNQAATVAPTESEEQLDLDLDSSGDDPLDFSETLTSSDDAWEMEIASAATTVASEELSSEMEPEASTIFSEEPSLDDMSTGLDDQLDLGDMEQGTAQGMELLEEPLASNDELDLGEMSFDSNDELDLGDISADSSDELDLGEMSFDNNDDLDLGDISADSSDELDLGEMSYLEEEEFQFGDISTDDPFEDNEDSDPLLNDVWQDLNEASQHNNH
ncbi:MAG: KGK domain-containing protein [Coleofasciculaceae cyanobacterium]